MSRSNVVFYVTKFLFSVVIAAILSVITGFFFGLHAAVPVGVFAWASIGVWFWVCAVRSVSECVKNHPDIYGDSTVC